MESSVLDIQKLISNDLMHHSIDVEKSSSTHDLLSVLSSIRDNWEQFFDNKISVYAITNADQVQNKTDNLFIFKFWKNSWKLIKENDVRKIVYSYDFLKDELIKNNCKANELFEEFAKNVISILKSAKNKKYLVMESE